MSSVASTPLSSVLREYLIVLQGPSSGRAQIMSNAIQPYELTLLKKGFFKLILSKSLQKVTVLQTLGFLVQEDSF